MINLELFVVIQQGVYRHDMGVFVQEDEAIAAARKCAREDRDSYHDWEVYRTKNNWVKQIDPNDKEEVNRPIFSTNKEKEENENSN